MAKPTAQDLVDFEDAMRSQFPPLLQKYVADLCLSQVDPRTTVAALETAAKTARGWCIGRFGNPSVEA